VYEVDSPAVLDFKEGTLRDHAEPGGVRRVMVRADLRKDWKSVLTGSGFDPCQRTAWVAEGLLMYLTSAQADTLLRSVISMSVPGSVLAGDYLKRRSRINDVPTSDEQDRAVAELFVATDRGGPDTAPREWLRINGWSGSQRDLVDELAAAGRAVPILFAPNGPDPQRVWLFTGALSKPAPG
jgi:methyltransferase (TIGR00027 family)